jgi:uncharacterized delta-60 repeat protein
MAPAASILRSASALAVVVAFASGSAMAQPPGSLDTTFGSGGLVLSNFNFNVSPLTAIEQPSGDIVVVAGFNNQTIATEAIALVRYTPSGKLDTTFGSKGVALAAFTDFINSPTSVAVLPNGDIIVVGFSETTSGGFQFAMARFTPNGALDSTFGSGGLVTVQPPGVQPAASVVMAQPNGQILVAGSVIGQNKTTPGGTVLGRYNSNGSLDATFGTGGFIEAPTAAGAPTALALLADGSYLAVGGTAVVQFSSTGVLQSTVTPQSVVATSLPAAFAVNPVVFLPGGEFIIGQTVGAGFQRTDDQIFRVSETGGVDSTFISTPFGFPGVKKSSPQALAVQSNGQILVGGVPFGMARLNGNGSLDPTFGNGGTVETPGAQVTGLMIQNDGKILAIGAGGPNGTEQLVLARYLPN